MLIDTGWMLNESFVQIGYKSLSTFHQLPHIRTYWLHRHETLRISTNLYIIPLI